MINKGISILGISIFLALFGLCSVGCKPSLDFDDVKDSISILPRKIDYDEVKGFAIVENNQNTKADGEITNSAPYSLYSINEKGQLTLSIFTFEVVCDDETGEIREIQNALENAVQVVPYIVTDLGKYVLFSGCEYQVNSSATADENIIALINEMVWQRYILGGMTFMVRKSDGAMFDLTLTPNEERSLFRYSTYTGDTYFDGYTPLVGSSIANYLHNMISYLPSIAYTFSQSGNLYTYSENYDTFESNIYKFVDNGNAVDVYKMTQALSECVKFVVDKDDNIFIYQNYVPLEFYHVIDVYNSSGGFYSKDFPNYNFFDLCVDDNEEAYLFLSDYDNFYSLQLTDDLGTSLESFPIDRENIPSFGRPMPSDLILYADDLNNYLGYNNESFTWCVEVVLEHDDISPITTYKLLRYNTKNKSWTFDQIPEDIVKILSDTYDCYVFDTKFYGVNISGNTIDVVEVDLLNKTINDYQLTVDIPSYNSPVYFVRMIQDEPFLLITEKWDSFYGPITPATKFSQINLTNGESNATYSTNNLNVVSVFMTN